MKLATSLACRPVHWQATHAAVNKWAQKHTSSALVFTGTLKRAARAFFFCSSASSSACKSRGYATFKTANHADPVLNVKHHRSHSAAGKSRDPATEAACRSRAYAMFKTDLYRSCTECQR